MKIVILGVSGSIGKQSIQVLNFLKNKGWNIQLIGAAVRRNIDYLMELNKNWNIDSFAISDEKRCLELKKLLKDKRIFCSSNAIPNLLEYTKPDITIVATAGSEGLFHSLSAVKHSKRVGLANKESIVCGGNVFLDFVKTQKTELIPIDSEHSALFQLMLGEDKPEEIIITASGGALRDFPLDKMEEVSPETVLKHPVWSMGKRITVDSATMANKGLEIIEAHYLFRFPKKKIKVLINRNSHVHSIVKFKDGVMKFHFGIPDMRIPIAYSITYPKRIFEFSHPDLTKVNIEFEEVDYKRYPLLKVAYDILGNLRDQIIFNAADEIAVDLFLKKKIKFTEIYKIIVKAIEKFQQSFNIPTTFDEIQLLDKSVREEVKRWG